MFTKTTVEISISVLVSILLLVQCGCSVGHKDNTSPDNRALAPNFILAREDGSKLSLSDLKNKVVILNFWAPWCSSCLEEFKAFQDLKSYFSADQFEILAVTVCDKSHVIISVPPNNFEVLVDKEGEVARKYDVIMLPVTFVIDKEQKLVEFTDPDKAGRTSKFVGPRGWNKKSVVDELQALIDE